MSIRSRLTLSFGLLAALSVLAAALVGYTSTSRRVRSELDLTLRQSVARLVAPGPDARICRFSQVSVADGLPENIVRAGRSRRVVDLPGGRAQCLDADGELLVDGRLVGSVSDAIPIDDRDRELARSRVNEPVASADPTPGRNRDRSANGPVPEPGSSDVRIRTSGANGETLRIATGALAGGGAFMAARDLDESNRVLDALRDRFVLIGLLVTVAAAALGAFVARAFAKPIRALTDVTTSIAANGALDEKIAIDEKITGRRDELGHLATSFGSMISSLHTSRSQQRQLAQDAGHELRTPLTTLRTNVDVLAKYPDLSVEKRALILREMHDELRELSALTDELLVLATDATPDDPVVDLNLPDVLSRSVERFERRTGRAVVVSLVDVAPLRGRRLQLSRAFDNLLANSAKFDASLQPIEAQISGTTIVVRDHGPGFLPGETERVFDRFYRSNAARSLPGTGLGLAIVADAAAAHRGTATASNHPDGGAVVTVALHDADSKADEAGAAE